MTPTVVKVQMVLAWLWWPQYKLNAKIMSTNFNNSTEIRKDRGGFTIGYRE